MNAFFELLLGLTTPNQSPTFPDLIKNLILGKNISKVQILTIHIIICCIRYFLQRLALWLTYFYLGGDSVLNLTVIKTDLTKETFAKDEL